jgi:ADP-ribosylglycohydrolase
MRDRFRACLLGAAMGDALGMPYETLPPQLAHIRPGFGRPSRWHPNAGLRSGQYTDDTQMMIIAADLLARGEFTGQRYAAALKRSYDEGSLRFPDGAVASACEHMAVRGYRECGVSSTTAGTVSLGLPFALVYDDVVDIREQLVQACSITHIHPAAYAGTIAFALLLFYTRKESENALSLAQKNAFLEDTKLGAKIKEALHLSRESISLQSALSVLGNDVSIYQTLPLAFFLIDTYHDAESLIYVAAHVGGNTDTIAFICGAYAGARFGVDALPPDLLASLENRPQLELMADRLYERFAGKD